MRRRTFVRSSLAAAAGLTLPRPALGAWHVRPGPRVPDVEAVTGDGRAVTLGGSDISDLASALRGRVLLAGEAGYDDARRILNPSFDKYPALITQVTGAADVATAVDFARDHGGLLLAVKCGGHSLSGKSTCDRGMMIDLSPFRDVRVDPALRRARVTGGSLLGALDHEAMAHGLVTTMGTVSHTGVGGLVTGGGFGRLGRRFGLSIDNLVSVDVVTADGRLLHASADENPDLFWGVRGGGGNFGVVTSFEFDLHPMQREVIAGSIMFPFERARDVLEVYGEYGPRSPDELQLDCGLLAPAAQPGMAGFRVCWSGAEADAERALGPMRRLGGTIVDDVRPIDYVALQKSGDVDDPRAMGQYTKSGFVTEIRPGLVDALVEGLVADAPPGTMVASQQGGGAIARVSATATAFPQRNSQANVLAFVNWPAGADPTHHIEWIRAFWTAVEPFTDGFYVNDLELEASAAAVRDNYDANHVRLVEVKNRYDPKNLFRLNANIVPTA